MPNGRVLLRLTDSAGRQMHVTASEAEVNRLITGLSESHRDVFADHIKLTVADSPDTVLDLDRMTMLAAGKLGKV